MKTQFKQSFIKQAAVWLLLAGAGISACATPTAHDLVLIDATACTKPRVTPPPPIKENEQWYNPRRSYFDLDGSGTCVLMDVWVERIGNSDAPGMRTLRQRLMHVKGGKWVPFWANLDMFPILLRSPSTRQTYLVIAPDTDIYDMGGGGIRPQVYMRGTWEGGDQFTPDTYSLLPVEKEQGHIYRALAAQLTQRTPPSRQTPGERDRIKALQLAAAKYDGATSSAPSR